MYECKIIILYQIVRGKAISFMYMNVYEYIYIFIISNNRDSREKKISKGLAQFILHFLTTYIYIYIQLQ